MEMAGADHLRGTGAAHFRNTNRNSLPCYERYFSESLWFLRSVRAAVAEVELVFQLLDDVVGLHLCPQRADLLWSRSLSRRSLHVWGWCCQSSPRVLWRICWTGLAPSWRLSLAEGRHCHRRYLKLSQKPAFVNNLEGRSL
jgi:hypothetical protein